MDIEYRPLERRPRARQTVDVLLDDSVLDWPAGGHVRMAGLLLAILPFFVSFYAVHTPLEHHRRTRRRSETQSEVIEAEARQRDLNIEGAIRICHYLESTRFH